MEKLDGKLISVLNKYSVSGSKGLGSTLAESAKKIKHSECIVPVLGMQGKGKSTLLNGILGTDVLPDGAKETTCIPVEIRYGETYSATLYFKSGIDPEQIEGDKESIRQYVDNKFNPGNEKGIDHIVISLKSRILEFGLVLVDLPGVGSLTYANEETTMRYLSKVMTGIFVTGVVPPMKGTERVFIKSCWTQFPYAIFVQNSWDDSEREVCEATNHNIKELKMVAESISTSFDEADLFTVNARDAIDKDLQLRDASGIRALQARLEKLAGEWSRSQQEYLDKRFVMAIAQTEKRIESLIEECHKTADEARLERQREYVDFHEKTQALLSVFGEYRKSVGEKEKKTLEYSKGKLDENIVKTREKVLSEVKKAHIYDGEHLDRILTDHQNGMFEILFEDILEHQSAVKIELEAGMSGIEGISDPEKMSGSSRGMGRERKFKFEDHLEVMGGAGGGLVALEGATPLAVAVLGSNPAGWAVLATGVVITMIGTGIGALIKGATRTIRYKDAEKAIIQFFDSVKSKIWSDIVSSNTAYFSGIREAIDGAENERKAADLALCEEADKAAEPAKLPELQDDLAFIKSIKLK